MGAEPQPTIMTQHDEFHSERINKRRLRGACFVRFVSALVFVKLILTLGTLAFLSLRSPHPVSLSPFEFHEVRFCPSWFRAVDVVAPFPASEYVTVHKFNGRPNITDVAETYNVGYDVELKSGHFDRTHSRSYYFSAGSTFDIEFEASSPVDFMILHPEHRQQYRQNRPRSEGGHREESEDQEGRHGHHGNHEGRHGHHEGGRHGHGPHSSSAEAVPATSAAAVAPASAQNKHVAQTRKQIRVTATGGRYDLIFAVPRNTTTGAKVNVRITANVKTLDISRSCPLRSSLTRGHRHVRLHKHAREHVVLAASPYARTSSLVYVRLVPREHKFATVSAILFGVWVVLRLVARYLRAHSGVKNGQGKCFWSRLCGRKSNNNVQYSPILQAEPQIQVVYPGQL